MRYITQSTRLLGGSILTAKAGNGVITKRHGVTGGGGSSSSCRGGMVSGSGSPIGRSCISVTQHPGDSTRILKGQLGGTGKQHAESGSMGGSSGLRRGIQSGGGYRGQTSVGRIAASRISGGTGVFSGQGVIFPLIGDVSLGVLGGGGNGGFTMSAGSSGGTMGGGSSKLKGGSC
ncbi:MAG: hypothetical protein ACOH5I_26310 [Oligoflexus sp.]